jgi:hypothetical protein
MNDYLPRQVKEMTVNPDGTCTITFTEVPAFIYAVVSNDPCDECVYYNRSWLYGWRKLKIETEVEDIPLIEIEGYPFKPSLAEILDKVTPENRHDEIDFGTVGDERL